jgi:hypothetical protein
VLLTEIFVNKYTHLELCLKFNMNGEDSMEQLDNMYLSEI